MGLATERGIMGSFNMAEIKKKSAKNRKESVEIIIPPLLIPLFDLASSLLIASGGA